MERVAASIYSSLQQSLGDLYSAFSIKISSLRCSAEAAADSIRKAVAQWGIDLVSSLFSSSMVFLNPRLTAAQQSQLLAVLSHATEDLLHRGRMDEQLLRSIVTLASPDRGTFLLLNYLIEAAITTGLPAPPAESCYFSSTAAADDDKDRQVALALIKKFGIHRAAVAAMSSDVRRAILQSLGGSGGTGSSAPICCITLEPLLWPDSTVTSDVVAVIQKNQRPGSDHDHAFLYRGSALFRWLGRSQFPIAPETRSIIKFSDIYRLS